MNDPDQFAIDHRIERHKIAELLCDLQTYQRVYSKRIEELAYALGLDEEDLAQVENWRKYEVSDLIDWAMEFHAKVDRSMSQEPESQDAA